MITTPPRKEFTLDYSMTQLVTTANSTLRLADHRLLDSNDVLKTYRIALVYGFNTAILTIQLTQIDETKTKCVFEIFNTVGSRIQPATLTGMLDKYLLTFTNLLTGKTKIVEKSQPQVATENQQTKTAGSQHSKTIWVWIIVIAVIIVILYFL